MIANEAAAEPTTGNRARVRRYRANHQRIDYVPGPDVMKIIDAWLACAPRALADQYVENNHRP